MSSPGHTLGGRRQLGLGLTLIVVAAVGYGITPAIVALGKSWVSLVDLLAYRAFFAALFMAVIAVVLGQGRALVARGSWRGLLVGATLLTADVLLFFSSINYLPTSLAMAIGFLYPTIVLLLVASLARRAPRLGDLALSLTAVGGVALMTVSGDRGDVQAIGLLLVAGSVIIYSLYVVSVGHISTETSPLVLAVHVQTGVAVSVGLIGLFTGQLTALGSYEAWRQVVLQALLLAGAIVAYLAGLSRLGPALASMGDTAQPIVALIAGAILLHEDVTALKVLGMALAIGAVTLASVRERRRVGASITGST